LTRITGRPRALLEGKPRFGTLATTGADGAIHQVVVWFLLRGDTIVVNSRVGRAWPTNLLRDPRCNLLVEDGYEWVSIGGSVETVTDQATAQADIAEMARRYQAHDPAEAERIVREVFAPQQRISFLLRPERVIEHHDR